MEQVHAVMIPFPLQSHIRPMLYFAKALLATEQEVMVTMVNNKHHHHRILARIHQPESDLIYCGIDQEKLNFVWLENGLPPDFDYADVSSRWQEYHAGFANMKSPLLSLLRSLKQYPPVSCVIFGSFCPWAPSVAAETGIPCIFFWTQSATVFSIYYHAPLLISHGYFPYKDPLAGEMQDASLIQYIPGVAPIHPANLPSIFHASSLNDYDLQLVRTQFEALRETDAVIINSCPAIERDVFVALQAKGFAVYLVGPLLPDLDAHGPKRTMLTTDTRNDQCLTWLDNQKERSVLYISFGSVFDPSVSDVNATALALKASRQPFLWAINPRAASSDVLHMLPDNFMEETEEFGLTVGWAPQLQVLAHENVAAFLTHCGWNSVLEGLSTGVPMLCLPTSSDQPTNGSLVVETWNAGISIKRGANGSVNCEDISKAMKKIVSDLRIRASARKVKEILRDAVQAEGISHTHLQNFVKSLKRRSVKQNDASFQNV
ncbi:hypothetical protein L7F22_053591 [Adiantum nelumboides]|nr:hypothetical protein [Adiantum nelumboides]